MTADLVAHSTEPRGGRRRRRLVALAALVLGVAGFAAAMTGVAVQLLPRQFTVGQQRQITAWEVSGRWRTLTAGQIFPASIGYQLSATVLEDTTPLDLQALRVAIAPQATCAAGVKDRARAGPAPHGSRPAAAADLVSSDRTDRGISDGHCSRPVVIWSPRFRTRDSWLTPLEFWP